MTPVAYYDDQGNPRDARGAIILYIGGPKGYASSTAAAGAGTWFGTSARATFNALGLGGIAASFEGFGIPPWLLGLMLVTSGVWAYRQVRG